MNNVIDEVLNTAATDNKVKYRITHSDSTTEDVTIELITPVTVQGTALNKALFDSIQADLNTRLLISSKATKAQAEAGTDETNYMTPKTVLDEIKKIGYPSYNLSIKTGKISHNGTIPKTSGYSHYMYFVQMHSVSDVQTGDYGSGNVAMESAITTYVDQSTRKVTCRMGSKRTTASSYTWVSGTADYLEIAWN